ncbi:MAG: hypothetical protein R6U61_02230 [Thermoplasmata archaeon]
MGECSICGKPTTSHVVGEYFVCHTCWTKKPEGVNNLKVQLERKEKRKNTVRGSGKEISKELDEVDSKEELFTVMDEYQMRLNESMTLDPKGNLFRKIEGQVCEKISNKFFEYAQEEGWPFVLNLIKKYGPKNEDVIDNVPIEEITGRMIVLTRWEEGVEKIPVKALEYLTTFHDAPDMEWETSFSCGFGFDHPDFDFKETIEKSVKKGESIWASGILERAFYADQKKAAPILIEFLKRDDISKRDKMALVQAITFFTDHKGWNSPDKPPKYWNWKEAVDYGRFEWNEEVKRSLKEAIEEELAEYIEDGQSKEGGMFYRTDMNLPVKDIDFSKGWSFEDLQL